VELIVKIVKYIEYKIVLFMELFMQGLNFVFICVLIVKFSFVHSIASHDAIFVTSLVSKGRA